MRSFARSDVNTVPVLPGHERHLLRSFEPLVHILGVISTARSTSRHSSVVLLRSFLSDDRSEGLGLLHDVFLCLRRVFGLHLSKIEFRNTRVAAIHVFIVQLLLELTIGQDFGRGSRLVGSHPLLLENAVKTIGFVGRNFLAFQLFTLLSNIHVSFFIERLQRIATIEATESEQKLCRHLAEKTLVVPESARIYTLGKSQVVLGVCLCALACLILSR